MKDGKPGAAAFFCTEANLFRYYMEASSTNTGNTLVLDERRTWRQINEGFAAAVEALNEARERFAHVVADPQAPSNTDVCADVASLYAVDDTMLLRNHILSDQWQAKNHANAGPENAESVPRAESSDEQETTRHGFRDRAPEMLNSPTGALSSSNARWPDRAESRSPKSAGSPLSHVFACWSSCFLPLRRPSPKALCGAEQRPKRTSSWQSKTKDKSGLDRPRRTVSFNDHIERIHLTDHSTEWPGGGDLRDRSICTKQDPHGLQAFLQARP